MPRHAGGFLDLGIDIHTAQFAVETGNDIRQVLGQRVKLALQTLNFRIRPHLLGDVLGDHHGPGDGALFVVQRQGRTVDDFTTAVKTLDVDDFIKGGFTALDGAGKRPVVRLDALARGVPPALVFVQPLDAGPTFACPDTAAGRIVQDEVSGCIHQPHADRQRFQHAAQLPSGVDGAPHHKADPQIDQQRSDRADAHHDRNRAPRSGAYRLVHIFDVYFAYHAETEFRHRRVGGNHHHPPIIRRNHDATLALEGMPHRDRLVLVACRRQQRARHECRRKADHVLAAGRSAQARFHPARRIRQRFRKQAFKLGQGLLHHDGSLPLRGWQMDFQHPAAIPGQPGRVRVFQAQAKSRTGRRQACMQPDGAVASFQPCRAARTGHLPQRGGQIRARHKPARPGMQAVQGR